MWYDEAIILGLLFHKINSACQELAFTAIQEHVFVMIGGVAANFFKDEISRLVQERCNCIANALELCLSCTNPLRWTS